MPSPPEDSEDPMSTGNVRRWQLALGAEGYAWADPVSGEGIAKTDQPKVLVREDRITDADLKAARDWLDELCTAVLEESEPFNDRNVEDDAKSFLDAIFDRAGVS